MHELLITNDHLNQRLDKFLSNELKISRASITKLIKEEQVLVNELPVKASYTLKINDQVKVLSLPTNEELSLVPVPMDLEIIFNNDDICIINKPSGLVVHPASSYTKNTLVNGLLATNIPLSDLNGDFRPGIVHRLDKDTSGAIIIAKHNEVHEKLKELMQNHKITRKYIALVHGTIKYDTGTIDAPIGRSPNNRKKNMVTEINSKSAITNFKVLKRFKKYTLVECELITGRTHQIRVHMEYIGHPIVGDPVYSKRKDNKRYGQFLHAHFLELNLAKKEISVKVDLPDYFNNYLSCLEEL